VNIVLLSQQNSKWIIFMNNTESKKELPGQQNKEPASIDEARVLFNSLKNSGSEAELDYLLDLLLINDELSKQEGAEALRKEIVEYQELQHAKKSKAGENSETATGSPENAGLKTLEPTATEGKTTSENAIESAESKSDSALKYVKGLLENSEVEGVTVKDLGRKFSSSQKKDIREILGWGMRKIQGITILELSEALTAKASEVSNNPDPDAQESMADKSHSAGSVTGEEVEEIKEPNLEELIARAKDESLDATERSRAQVEALDILMAEFNDPEIEDKAGLQIRIDELQALGRQMSEKNIVSREETVQEPLRKAQEKYLILDKNTVARLWKEINNKPDEDAIYRLIGHYWRSVQNYRGKLKNANEGDKITLKAIINSAEQSLITLTAKLNKEIPGLPKTGDVGKSGSTNPNVSKKEAPKAGQEASGEETAQAKAMRINIRRATDSGFADDEIAGKTADELKTLLEERNYRAYKFLTAWPSYKSLDDLKKVLKNSTHKPSYIPAGMTRKDIFRALRVYEQDKESAERLQVQVIGKEGEKSENSQWPEVELSTEWDETDRANFVRARADFLHELESEPGYKPEYLPGFRKIASDEAILIAEELKKDRK